MFCYKCGSKLSDDALFCSKCGEKVSTDTGHSSENKKEKLKVSDQTSKTIVNEKKVEQQKNETQFSSTDSDNFDMAKIIEVLRIGGIIAVFIVIICTVTTMLQESYDENIVSGSQSNEDIALMAEQQKDLATDNKRIEIGELHIIDGVYGKIEATLDYVEFTDNTENTLWDDFNPPAEGNTYLIAVFTIKNINTATSTFLPRQTTLIYDDIYEYDVRTTSGNCDVEPLGQTQTCYIVYEIPETIAESNKSFAINYEVLAANYSIDSIVQYTVRNSEIEFTAEGNTKELYYDGLPLTEWIGGNMEILLDILGYPEFGTPIDGSQYYGGDFYGYDGNVMFVNDYRNNTIGWITGPTDAVEVNGTSLYKTRNEIIELMGEPDNEEAFYDEMIEQNFYYMYYSVNDVSIVIQMANADSIAERFTITTSRENVTEDTNLSLTTDKILLKDIPIEDIIGMSAEKVIEIFGEPEVYTAYDSIEYDTSYSERLSFDLSEENTVDDIVANAEKFSFNGQILSQDFDTIVSILGESYEYRAGGRYTCPVAWLYEGYDVVFDFPIIETDEWNMDIYVFSASEEDPSINGMEVSYTDLNADTVNVSVLDLIGTWAFADNGNTTLTLYSNGSCSGSIGRYYNPDTKIISTITPTTWMFLEYEQVIQIPIVESTIKWDMLGKYAYEGYDYNTLNYKVSMKNGVLFLENTEDADTKWIEYVKVP